MDNIKELDSKYIAHTYSRNDLVIKEGMGAVYYDENGHQYTDLTAGIGVNIFGACDEEWVSAVTGQLCRLQHTSNLYYTEPQARLAKMLCEKTGMKSVFFSNSGAEANECAIKACRKYSFDKYGEGRNTIITLKNSFHGRTVTTLSATGQDVFHTVFGPFTEGFVYAEANNFEDIVRLCGENENKICGIMMEMVQGEGGVIALDADYVKKTALYAAEKDILIIIDEVQTGNGRTGSLYAYMQYGITPDIFSTAKGLAGGLPMGATLFSDKVSGVYTPSDHGSTFGGNPVCAAGAINVLSRLDDDFLLSVSRKANHIREVLSSCKYIRNISGLGMMIGFETDVKPSDFVKECMKRGVLVLTAKSKIRLLPPLNIDDELLDNALAVIMYVAGDKNADVPKQEISSEESCDNDCGCGDDDCECNDDKCDCCGHDCQH